MFLPVNYFKIWKGGYSIGEIRKAMEVKLDAYNLEFRRVGYILSLGYNPIDAPELKVPNDQAKRFYSLKDILILPEFTLYDAYKRLYKAFPKPCLNSYRNLCGQVEDKFYDIIIGYYISKYCSKGEQRKLGYAKLFNENKRFHLTPIVHCLLEGNKGYVRVLFAKRNYDRIKLLIKRLRGMVKKIKPMDNEINSGDRLMEKILIEGRFTNNTLLYINRWLDTHSVNESSFRMELIKGILSNLNSIEREYNRWS